MSFNAEDLVEEAGKQGINRAGNAAALVVDPPEIERRVSPISDAALYGLPGEVVRVIEPHTESDPAAILLQYLVALGNVVGRNPHFVVEATHHYLNLFVVLVGDTSKARKGTSWAQVNRIFAAVETKRGSETCGWPARIVSGLSSGEGLIWEVQDPGTFDGERDTGITDKRRIVIDSEFAQTLSMFRRQGNTLSPVIRNAWDSGDLRITTKNNPASATAGHISIIAHITGTELKRQLTSTQVANGFANRFLWAAVRRSKLLPDGGDLQDKDLKDIIEGTREVIGEAHTHKRIKRNDDARELWRNVYGDLSEGQDGLLGEVTARAEAQVVRLSCLYAVADLSDEIRPEHLRAALAVWEYCNASALFIFGACTGDANADRLHSALRTAGSDGMSRTRIRDFFGRNLTSTRIEAVLALLKKKHLAKCDFKDQTEIWFATSR